MPPSATTPGGPPRRGPGAARQKRGRGGGGGGGGGGWVAAGGARGGGGGLGWLDDPRAVATALCTRAEFEFALGRSGDAVTSVRRAIGVLVPADEDIVWALGILVFALPESPLPVSEGEALLDGLMEELGE